MNRYVVLVHAGLMALLLASCAKPADEPGAPKTTALSGKAVVQWPDLKALDDSAEKAETPPAGADLASLRQLGTNIKAAALQVAQDPLPAGAHQPEQVKVLQKDLGNLTQSLADPATMSEANLRQVLPGFHPIVEQLMETAGMPHVHEHAGEAEHGHNDDKPTTH